MNIVVLSGGLDSTVCCALASAEGPVLALTFDYGQRHRIELGRAAAVAQLFGAEQLVVRLDASQWGGSALTDAGIDVPDHDPAGPGPAGATARGAIPVTYVPGRNLIFLAVAVAVAEARDAEAVYLGVNALDYSGYPDCRPEFVRSFEQTAALALKRGTEGRPVEIRTPLQELTKAEIVSLGLSLGAPLHLSWSCYREGPEPCGRCDACGLRARGFAQAGVADPAQP